MSRNFSTVTVAFLQQTQPWTIPYSKDVNGSPKHLDRLGAHTVLHATKTVGQLAAVFERLEHQEGRSTKGDYQVVMDKAADLATAAIRLANLYGFSLARAVVERSEEKNSVTLPAWE